MSMRQVNMTIATLCVAGAALAQQVPQTAETAAPLLVAAATTGTGQSPAVQIAAQRPVHGTLRGVLAAADQGPQALRRYLWRTRMIYGYQYDDFARPEWDR